MSMQNMQNISWVRGVYSQLKKTGFEGNKIIC